MRVKRETGFFLSQVQDPATDGTTRRQIVPDERTERGEEDGKRIFTKVRDIQGKSGGEDEGNERRTRKRDQEDQR